MAVKNLKYVFVTGGVISGLGKGIATASIALILKKAGFKVAPIKCDMYLNVDAGTMNPFEHGEIFVTDDGEECDQDIGHYERFLNQSLEKKNYITTGQIYWQVLNKERALNYEGKCVETFPAVTEEIKERFHKGAKGNDFVIIELGGTVGEYQNIVFLETARRIASENAGDVCFIHLGYLPIPPSLGEMKTKPIQQSIMALNSVGIRPDVVICRGEKKIDKIRQEKVAVAAGLLPKAVISSPDIEVIYRSSLILEGQSLSALIFEKLNIKSRKPDLDTWRAFVEKTRKLKKKVKIAIVAKYYSSGNFSLKDSYISVTEAIKHAAWANNVKPEIIWYDSQKYEKEGFKGLDEVDGIIVPQGWGSRGVKGKIKAVRFARENKIPYLGLCFGMQMATIEFARNVCGLKGSNSTEVNPKTPHPVIHIMPDQEKYLKKRQYGGTIRLGAWPCIVKKGTQLYRIYKEYKKNPKSQIPNPKQTPMTKIQNSKLIIHERHRHRYEFNQKYKKLFEEKGMIFSGLSPDGKLVEAIELPKETHPFFVGTQFHPEFKSRPLLPHPIFMEFLKAVKKRFLK